MHVCVIVLHQKEETCITTALMDPTVVSFQTRQSQSDLELGVYEAAVNIFKDVNLEPGEYFLQGMRKINKERFAKAKKDVVWLEEEER